VKQDLKREACASIMPKTETGNEKWSTLVSWEDPAIKAERRRNAANTK